MYAYWLILLCVVGISLGMLPYAGAAYAIGVSIAYLTRTIYLFDLIVVLMCVAAGGGVGWLVRYLGRKNYEDKLSSRSMCLWNAISAIALLAYSYGAYLLKAMDGFMGVFIACTAAVALGIAYSFEKNRGAPRCVVVFGEELCVGRKESRAD